MTELDIVIPCRAEGQSVLPTLSALLADSSGLKICVVLSLNGEQQDETYQAVQPFQCAFSSAGHNFLIVRSEEVGKPAALNCGDAARHGEAVIYLDADAVILPGTLRAVLKELASDDPRLVGVRRELIYPQKSLARGFSHVWGRLPNVEDFIGAGCYAVNKAGRGRWGKFPDLVADDAFVFRSFEPEQRRIAADGAIWFAMPEGRALIRTVRRWRDGNRELAASAPAATKRRVDFRWLLKNPEIIRHFPAFALVNILSLAWHSPVKNKSWIPESRNRDEIIPARKFVVRVVIVSYNSEDYIENCIRSISSSWANIEIVIVDNNSQDETLEIIESMNVGVTLIKNLNNMGFSSAVNQASRVKGSYDFILLCNPDAALESNNIDNLISLGMKCDSAIVGGRMIASDGTVDHTSALSRPGVYHAFAFALGFSAWPFGRILDPDRLGGWDRSGTRHVPVVTGGLCLIRSSVWSTLGGLDEAYFLYGEDVDFCVRAHRQGASLLTTDRATYSHVGGASSGNSDDRMVRIIRAKRQLYSSYARPVGVYLLSIGVLVRAAAEKFLTRRTKWRKCAEDLFKAS